MQKTLIQLWKKRRIKIIVTFKYGFYNVILYVFDFPVYQNNLYAFVNGTPTIHSQNGRIQPHNRFFLIFTSIASQILFIDAIIGIIYGKKKIHL